MVFGDSDGDAWMLRDFKGTQVGVIVNRIKKGEIGIDSQLAAASAGAGNARFMVGFHVARMGSGWWRQLMDHFRL